jgi:sulfur carrier protein
VYLKVILNGKEENLANAVTVGQLLDMKGCKLNSVIVVVNSSVVRKEDWDNFVISENDQVEIVRIVGGG